MMNDVELIFSAVQQEADATKDFGLREFVGILAITVGIGLLLTLIGAAL